MKRMLRTVIAHIVYFITGRVLLGVKYNGGVPLRFATKEAACADLTCISGTTIEPGEVKRIPLGLSFDIPKGFELHINLRSSAGLQGLIIPNGMGIIDSDYRGEINLILTNICKEPYHIKRGHRLAQLSAHRSHRIIFHEIKELSKTARGTGGLGSTGK